MVDLNSWYEVARGGSLEQGDLLMGISVPEVTSLEFDGGNPAANVEVATLNVTILTQTCDLENEKIDSVMVALLHSYDELARNVGGAVKGTKFREGLIQNGHPAYFLLPLRSDEPKIPWSVVDFHRVFTLSLTLVKEFTGSVERRLRLRSPYKEHLGQSFGKFMMRVALPEPLDDFRSYQPVG